MSQEQQTPHVEQQNLPLTDGAVTQEQQEQAEAKETERVAAMTDVATTKEQQKAAQAQEISFEEQVRRVEKVVLRQPLNREIAYGILRYCLERHVLADIEQFVQAMPEFKDATLDPYHQIERLEKCGGLERFDLDENGEIVTAEQFEGLTEDQIDDLIKDYAFQTTDAGEQAIEEGKPEKRMEGLFEVEPERKDTYIELLTYFDEESRSYQDVCDLLTGRDVMYRTLADGSKQKIQPSVFVDRLERAGMIVWKKGWVLTDEGRQFLGGLAS